MSARDDILAAVRAAVRGTSVVDVPSVHRPVAPDLVSLFVERVADYRAEVLRCSSSEVADALRSALGGARTVVVPSGFPHPVPQPVADTGQSATELDVVDAVVTTAALGIATTGTIVLDHGPGQGRRALSLVPDVHVCVVREDQIVHGVPDAVALLDPRRPQTWISGPSATSDIELSRVEGVHGPRVLRVIVTSGP